MSKKYPDVIYLQDCGDEITWCEDEITELESANRWIPCDERLPELNKLVNVTYKYKKEVSVSAAYHHGNNLWSIHGVTHWRPLPPAPNGEE